MAMPMRLRDLERLEQLYAAGFHDAFLDNALRKVVAHQIARDEADSQQVERDMAAFEAQYRLSSDEFWRRYQAGEMGDSADFVEWNVLCKMRQRLLTRLGILRGDSRHESESRRC